MINGNKNQAFFTRDHISMNPSDSETEIDEVDVTPPHLLQKRRVRIFDRFTMILQIFAKRART
jgi:hypothetical protein